VKGASGRAEPAFFASHGEEGLGVLGNRLALAGKGGVEIGDDVVGGALAVAALEDFGGSRVEFDQAFRVEQDVRILAGFPAEDVMRIKLRTIHVFSPGRDGSRSRRPLVA